MRSYDAFVNQFLKANLGNTQKVIPIYKILALYILYKKQNSNLHWKLIL